MWEKFWGCLGWFVVIGFLAAAALYLAYVYQGGH